MTTPAHKTGQTALTDVRQVKLYWIKSAPTDYMVLSSEVDTFVEATKRLHWKPGINPHNKHECSKIWRITVAPLDFRGPFWWTVPDLQNDNDPLGSRIIDGGRETVVFDDEEYIARLRAEEAEEEAAHYRAVEARAALSATRSETR